MKRFPQTLLSAVFLLNIAVANGQITKASPEEFKEIKARTLIVELLEIDENFIQAQQKQLGKAKKQETKDELQADIDNHRRFVEGYNNGVKNAVQKLWDLNKTVEYKKRSEIEHLKKTKSKEYTVLFFSESSVSIERNDYLWKPGIYLPTLNYSRIEKGLAKIDYSFFMPSTGKDMCDADLTISLKIMKNHIAQIEKSGENNYTAKDFGKDQAKANCTKLQGKTLLLDKDYLKGNTTPEEAASANTNNKVEAISSDDIRTAINKSEEKIVALNIPYGIKASSGSMLAVARVQYMKSLVNANNGEILYVNGVAIGEMYDEQWRANQISKIGNCN